MIINRGKVKNLLGWKKKYVAIKKHDLELYIL